MLNPFQNTYNHNPWLNGHPKKSRKADRKGGGINPYGQPDRKETVFLTTPQSTSQIKNRQRTHKAAPHFGYQPQLAESEGSGKGVKMTLLLSKACEAPHRQPLNHDEHREHLSDGDNRSNSAGRVRS